MALMSGSSSAVSISLENLTLDQIIAVACHGEAVALSGDPAFRQKLENGRSALERRLAEGEIVYGVNTGFGGNARRLIPDDEMSHHQANLLEFLSCGTGEPLSEEIVRAAILLRANALARGLSGVRPVVIERLIDALNLRITPIVPRFGSVGASGDLCPSAHIARALTGQGGEVLYRGQRITAAAALEQAGLKPLRLESKEGLALLNGTTTMTAIAAKVVDDAAYLFHVSLGALAMAAEALRSSPDYFHPTIHLAKHHPGQITVAETMNSLLFGSRLAVPLEDIRHRVEQERKAAHGTVGAHESVQSPYSLRCIPQGLGPMVETLEQVRVVVEREANSVNDNPLIDPVSGSVYHTGNFYGAHIARAMDGLKLDLANLANWQHSVMGLLMDDRFSNGLPPSLSAQVGVYHSFKGMQLSHSSLVTAIRHWCAPSLIHTLPTEQFNQDVVSLGTHAAATAMDVVRLLRDAVSITLLSAAQAVDLREGGELLGAGTHPIYQKVRSVSAFVKVDRALERDIATVSELIDQRKIPVLRSSLAG